MRRVYPDLQSPIELRKYQIFLSNIRRELTLCHLETKPLNFQEALRRILHGGFRNPPHSKLPDDRNPPRSKLRPSRNGKVGGKAVAKFVFLTLPL